MAHTITVVANPNEFEGYPVDLLKGLAGMGKALIGDDKLFAAVQAYNASAVAGGAGVLGPALLTKDASITVKGAQWIHVPEEVVAAKPVAPVADVSKWDDYDLQGLLDKVKQHGVTVDGRVKTPAKLIAALEAAGVTP